MTQSDVADGGQWVHCSNKEKTHNLASREEMRVIRLGELLRIVKS
jgi:hypothetical protein